jgi:hypothetical protein
MGQFYCLCIRLCLSICVCTSITVYVFEAYEITLLSVCLSVSVSPKSLRLLRLVRSPCGLSSYLSSPPPLIFVRSLMRSPPLYFYILSSCTQNLSQKSEKKCIYLNFQFRNDMFYLLICLHLLTVCGHKYVV